LAKPTTRIERRVEESEIDLDKLMRSFAQKQNALNELIDVIELLHKTGILSALKAVLERYEELLDVLSEWLTRQGGYTKLFELLNAFTQVDVQALSRMLRALSQAKEVKDASLSSLLRALEDEDVRRGLSMLLQIVKELGKKEQDLT
jgi:uncharacterized protein YjgD (DUF1641 family)